MGFTNLLLRTQWPLVRETPLLCLYHRIPCCLLASGGVQSTRSGADPYCQSTVGLCMATKGQFNEQGGCSWSWCLWLWSEEDEEYQSLMVLLGYYLNIGQMFADCSAAFGK